MFDTATAYTVWVCVDCYEAHHGADDDWEDAGHTPDREPLALISDDAEVTSGLLWEAHAEDCPGRIDHELSHGTAYPDATECECERRTFSRSACDGCGSALGGAREALTVWPAADAAPFGGVCLCPGDCGCHPIPGRVNVCGCKGHP